MYSDILFNFSQMIENSAAGPAYGAETLTQMAAAKPFFALDSGLVPDDVWRRADIINQCLEEMDNEDERKVMTDAIHFSAGIMGSYDSVYSRYEYIEKLEEAITAFKESDNPFAEKLVAIGPCGIDHDWESVEYEGRDHDYFDAQTVSDERDLFALQMTLAKKLNMPVIVHSRKGFKETSDVLKAVKWNKGVIHGYSYSKSELDFFLDLGWYISFNGSVTYSGKQFAQDMAETVAYVPKDRILVETDSPYYAPRPLKNTANNPVNINYIYDYLASKRDTGPSKLSALVDENCRRLFLS